MEFVRPSSHALASSTFLISLTIRRRFSSAQFFYLRMWNVGVKHLTRKHVGVFALGN